MAVLVLFASRGCVRRVLVVVILLVVGGWGATMVSGVGVHAFLASAASAATLPQSPQQT